MVRFTGCIVALEIALPGVIWVISTSSSLITGFAAEALLAGTDDLSPGSVIDFAEVFFAGAAGLGAGLAGAGLGAAGFSGAFTTGLEAAFSGAFAAGLLSSGRVIDFAEEAGLSSGSDIDLVPLDASAGLDAGFFTGSAAGLVAFSEAGFAAGLETGLEVGLVMGLLSALTAAALFSAAGLG